MPDSLASLIVKPLNNKKNPASVRRAGDCLAATDTAMHSTGGAPSSSRAVFGLNLALVIFLVFLFASPFTSAAQTGRSRTADIQAHLQRAQNALKNNQPEVAATELRAVLALDPQNADALANLGVIAFFQGDCRAASQDFSRALAVRPAITQAKALLGICEIRLGNGAGAALLQSSYSEIKDKKLRTEVGMELADFYYREGDFDRASPLLQSLVEDNPDDINVLYLAQRVYTEMADGIVNKLAVEAPGSARMQEVIAERLVNEGDVQGAIKHYKKALAIDPHLAGVHFELGESILQLTPADPRAQAEAEKEIETARAKEGDSAAIECQLGRIALLRGDTEQAHVHYQHAFQLNPGNAEAQLGLGSVLMKMQKPQEALKYLRMAVQTDPLNSEAHYQLAMTYRNLQMPDDAEKQMRLFQEIKQTMDQVRTLYRQMNQQPKSSEASPPAPSR
ncbi:MAG TPA: tetratricopeptide repeat protein [Terriglobia bacterium]|nr:tetratricopeptide repeat protein [Terriglobia bacterium]